MAEIVKTRDGDEVLVHWTCPSCGHKQDDTVHPEYGPWGSCTCSACEQTFYSEDGLSAEDKAAWDQAREAAQKMIATEAEGRTNGCDTLSMSPPDAWLYAASWGSYVQAGDPGACMYGFNEHFRVQSEKHREQCTAYMEQRRADVLARPDEFQPGELQKMDSFLATLRAAPVEIPGFSTWLARRYGRRWCVAPRLTDRMRRQGYEVAISQKKYAELEVEFERMTGAEARRIAADYADRYVVSLTDVLSREGRIND